MPQQWIREEMQPYFPILGSVLFLDLKFLDLGKPEYAFNDKD